MSAKPSSQTVSSSLKKSPLWVAPALLTRTSSRPNACSSAPTAACAALRRAQVGRADLDPPAARVADRRSGLLQIARRARDDQHVATLLRETLGAGAPDAPAAARDQRDLAVQAQIHQRPPWYTPFAFIAASSASLIAEAAQDVLGVLAELRQAEVDPPGLVRDI